MSVLGLAEKMLEKGFASLQTECRMGVGKGARAIAYSGVRCAELLSELLHSINDPVRRNAVEDAARKAPAWLIAYPALDDGRTNRIASQLPEGLKISLKISARPLRATKKFRNERPGVKTFLAEGIDHLNESTGSGVRRMFGMGAVKAALIMLHRECTKGDANAVLLVAKAGVEFADFLAAMLESSVNSKEFRAVMSAAPECPEWPVALRAGSRIDRLDEMIPSTLGQDSPIRIRKHSGTKPDRIFDAISRVGLANYFLDELQRGRRLAREYTDGDTANLLELISQGRVAKSVLGQDGFERHPAIFASVDRNTLEALILETGTIVPRGYEELWQDWRRLPDFNRKNLEEWLTAAMKLAHATCEGKWADGPWPPSLKTVAENRTQATGQGIEVSYQEMLRRSLRDGFEMLLIEPRSRKN